MNTPLAIIGAGGHGKVVADAAFCTGDWSSIDFFDDGKVGLGVSSEWNVVGCIDDLFKHRGNYAACVVALGDNQLRLSLAEKLLSLNFELATIIHPSATVSQFCSVASGTVVFAGSVINIDAHLGLACIVNTSSVVEHDCMLSDGVHICPTAALAGGVVVGKRSTVGIGSSVTQNIKIGKDVIVGAGAAVINGVKDGLVVAGTPARSLNAARSSS